MQDRAEPEVDTTPKAKSSRIFIHEDAIDDNDDDNAHYAVPAAANPMDRPALHRNSAIPSVCVYEKHIEVLFPKQRLCRVHVAAGIVKNSLSLHTFVGGRQWDNELICVPRAEG